MRENVQLRGEQMHHDSETKMKNEENELGALWHVVTLHLLPSLPVQRVSQQMNQLHA